MTPLRIALPNKGRLMEQVTTAGTIFLRAASSVAFGDYMTGANHVLARMNP